MRVTADGIVPRETEERLRSLAALVLEESRHQNLIARSTEGDIWQRHIVDSLQLLPLAVDATSWLDIGSGAGFPGLVVSVARPFCRMTLIEPRGRRVEFLGRAIEALGLENVSIIKGKAGQVPVPQSAIVTARAVASLDDLFGMTVPDAGPDTVWLLPKGRTAAEELAEARRTWQGHFQLVPSITDPEASIVMARNVRRRNR